MNIEQPYVVIARYRAVAGEADHVAAALARMVEPTRAEPGNLAYLPCRSTDDPNAFAIVEQYVDEAAFEAHLASEHFATWLRGEVLPRLAERERLTLVPIE